jgi:hypothetical protein
VRLLERRRGELVDRLQRGERSLARRARPMDEYEQSIAEHAQETAANDLSWIERLLERERTAIARTARVARRATAAPTKDSNGAPLPATVGAGDGQDGRQRP